MARCAALYGLIR